MNLYKNVYLKFIDTNVNPISRLITFLVRSTPRSGLFMAK